MDTIPLPARDGSVAYGMKTIPGSDVLLYSEIITGGAIGATSGRILALRPRTGDTLFVTDGVIMDWSQTGHVVVGREGGFVDAVPFDPKAFRVMGPPRQVLASIAGIGPVINFAGSRAGALAYFSGPVGDSSERRFELRWRGLDGRPERIPMPATDPADAAVSPDGERIAYVRTGRIWVFNGRSGRDVPLSNDTLGAEEHDPAWSPDGRRLAFASTRAGMVDDQGDLFVQTADGSTPEVRAGGTPGVDALPRWLSDSTILFVAERAGRRGLRREQGDIYTVVVGRPGSEKALLESPFDEHFPSVDPSGRWLP